MVSVKILRVINSVWTSIWTRSTLIGVIGGVPFGLIIQFWMGNMIDVGAMYGDHSVIRGWIAHLFHSIVGAIVFTGVVSHTRLKNHAIAPSRKVAVGVVYGLVLWAVFSAVILPIWLDVVTQWGGGIPLLDSKLRFPATFIGFVVYGLIVSVGVRLPTSTAENHQNESGNDSDDKLNDLFNSGFVWVTDESDDQQ